MADEKGELRITISPKAGDSYPVVVAAPFIFGEPTGRLVLDVGSAGIGKWLSYLEQDRASDRFFKELGSFLFRGLLSGDLATTYELNMKQAQGGRASSGLRVSLRILADELRCLPWEALYHPVQEKWLCTSAQSPLSRYVDALAPPSVRVSLPLRILICVAEPVDLPSAAGRVELGVLQGALEQMTSRGAIEVHLVRGACRESLRRALEGFRPQLFHFIGHGVREDRVAHLALERSDRTSDLLSADLLRELLERPGTVRAAVLNACKSDVIAYSLARQGMVSVGMQYAIRSEAAVCFCRGFYEALASGVDLDAAVNCARFAVHLECGADRRDWCVPVAFLPGGAARLFEIEEPVGVVQVRSSPAGARIYVDGRDTGKTTPDTLVIEGNEVHRVAVHKEGCKRPVPQEVRRAPGGEPVRLDFEVTPDSGFIAVQAGRPSVRVSLLEAGRDGGRLLGITGQSGDVGPLAVCVGRYCVEGVCEAGGASRRQRLVARAEGVVIREGSTTRVILDFPAPAPRWRESIAGRLAAMGRGLAAPGKKLWLMSAAVVALLGLLVVIARCPAARKRPEDPKLTRDAGGEDRPNPPNGGGDNGGRPETTTPRHTPPPPGDMVAIPAGRLCKGSWGESAAGRLIREHGRAYGPLIDIRERRVAVRSFFIDTYEVTNAQYRRFLADVQRNGNADVRHPGQPLGKDHTPKHWHEAKLAQPDQPVVGVDWYDAYAYAAWAKKRLPTQDEWELAARGKERLLYPWGNEYDPQRYAEGLRRGKAPRPVRSLRPPRSGAPVGLSNNVAEWTATPRSDSSKVMFIRGGSWSEPLGEIYAVTFRPSLLGGRTGRQSNVGFRCARDVGAGPPPADMVRIQGGDVRLGGEDTPLLRVVRKYKKLIPNWDRVFLGDKPTMVDVPAFRIDRLEVTNAQYRKFLDYVRSHGDERFRHAEQEPDKDHTPEQWSNPAFNQPSQPVVGVDWYDAYAYARWAGKRLPTGAEWEMAARGTDKHLYPWGDEFEATRCACAEAGCKAPAPGGSYPGDRSPFGVLDMAGNVREFTSDAYKEGSALKAVRGGAWGGLGETRGLTYVVSTGAPPACRDRFTGFRCVADPKSE